MMPIFEVRNIRVTSDISRGFIVNVVSIIFHLNVSINIHVSRINENVYNKMGCSKKKQLSFFMVSVKPTFEYVLLS